MEQRVLKILTAVAVAAMVISLVLAGARGEFSGPVAQVFLCGLGIFLGALLMLVHFRRVTARQAAVVSPFRTLAVAAILASQVAYQVLVWSNWRTSSAVWRFWWVSMILAVTLTHLVLLRRSSGRRWRPVEAATAAFVLSAAGMALWLGLRRDMLADVSPAYLVVGAVPAAGTLVLSVYLAARWAAPRTRRPEFSKRTIVAGVLLSHLLAAIAAFYIGRATAGRSDELIGTPHRLVSEGRREVRRQLDEDKYEAQSHVAEYLGDTRIVDRPPFITIERIEAIQQRLKPGDILLERRNWYLSNPMLPGFWPHAALYVGTIEDLRELGVLDHPSVAAHIEEYRAPAEDGRPHTVIEAVSEGVILNSLTHSMHADYAAALRPRVTSEDVQRAIVRAFENLGKPYDFNFDFEDTDRLVCSQVVYLSYMNAIGFPLKSVLGRNTLPANEIARKYVNEREAAERDLDFVFFLDAVPAESSAREVGVEEFCASVGRPRELVER
ncbi:MAG: YiiX/YebB-like N1pC/P60 family cysteine hydrolase [Planctomycetota bacterium]|jgi:hypothetical protein